MSEKLKEFTKDIQKALPKGGGDWVEVAENLMKMGYVKASARQEKEEWDEDNINQILESTMKCCGVDVHHGSIMDVIDYWRKLRPVLAKAIVSKFTPTRNKCTDCNGSGVGFQGSCSNGEVEEPLPCETCDGSGSFTPPRRGVRKIDIEKIVKSSPMYSVMRSEYPLNKEPYEELVNELHRLINEEGGNKWKD